MEIRELTAADYPAVKAIYLEGIATKQATFQTEAPDWEAWDSSHLQHSRFVAIDGDQVAGWVALSAVSSRCVYAGVAEVSVYIAADHRGKGVGHALMQTVIQSSETRNIWTIQAGIFPENEASMSLHYKNGFRLIGIREKIGKMEAVWRDTAILERRSTLVGID
jgi:L-amino acid N-acyltransferase YncA